MSSDPTFNPFEAPKSQHLPIPVIEELGFIVDEQRILCRGQVRLPQICVATGDTENLISRSRKLRRLAGRYSFILIMVAIGTFAAAIFGSGFGGTLPMLFIGMLVLMGAIAVAAAFGQQTVEAHWFVSQRYIRRNRRIRMALAAGIALFFAALFWWVGEGQITWNYVILTTIAMTLISFAYNPETRIEIIGMKEDLFILRGPSKRFFQQVAINSLGSSEVIPLNHSAAAIDDEH